MSFSGADTARLRGLAAQTDQTLDALQNAKALLVEMCTIVPTMWVGADADRFVGSVNSEHLPALGRAIGRLERAANDMRTAAQQQDDTSARL